MARGLTLLSILLVLCALPSGRAAGELATVEEATLVAGNWTAYIADGTGSWGGSARA